jgi:hypothetical protein
LERIVSDPRLTRLASLWRQGLEAALSSAEEAELKALLNDAVLAEAWVEAQAGREETALAAAGALPARLRMAFQRQFKPWTYWGLRLGLPAALAVAAYCAWPRQEGPQVLDASVDETPFRQEASRPERRAQQPDLGPPPGLDQRAHLWVSRTARALQFEVDLPRPAHLATQIVNAEGKAVQTLDLGRHAAGKARVAWDGRLAEGRKAPAGRYQARVYLDGVLDLEKELIVEKK